jgi:hypothetical protein
MVDASARGLLVEDCAMGLAAVFHKKLEASEKAGFWCLCRLRFWWSDGSNQLLVVCLIFIVIMLLGLAVRVPEPEKPNHDTGVENRHPLV